MYSVLYRDIGICQRAGILYYYLSLYMNEYMGLTEGVSW